MRKMPILFLLLGLITLPTLFVVAEVKYVASVPVTVEDFETPGNWTIDFSSLRCDTWESPDWVKNNAGDTTPTPATANSSNNAAPAAGANSQQPQVQNATPAPTPADNTTPTKGSGNDWIRWISVDSIQNERKLTFLPLALQKNDKDKNIMGFKGCWKNQGYNWVSVSPKSPLYSPSFPVSFSMYVWGNNYKYDLFLVVKNSENIYHNLFLGSLNFSGWRELRVNFPAYVFPANSHNDNSRLEIVKLKVLTKPNEDPVGFYTYFDNMTVQQSFEQTGVYDGASLNDEKW